AFGEIHHGAGPHRHEGGEGALGDMAERQEGQLLIRRTHRYQALAIGDLKQDIGVADHRTLRRSGGARSVNQDGEVVRLRLLQTLFPDAGVLLLIGLAELDQLVEADYLRVAEITQTFQIVYDDLGQARAALAYLEDL